MVRNTRQKRQDTARKIGHEMKGIQNVKMWECCGKYYSAAVKQCKACGSAKGNNNLERNKQSEPKCCKLQALELPPQIKKAMELFTGQLLVRITRQANSAGLDDDNLTGGCKELRDAIAEALGRPGDSAKDGLRFEYCQTRGPAAMMIEIFTELKN